MPGDINERLTRFLHALELHDIKPMLLHSENTGPMPPPGSELKLEWKQSFANGDPLATAPETRIFRPKYKLSVNFEEIPIFKQVSVFIIGFTVTDMAVFEELWADEELRKVFMEKQIQRTLWPLFRQHTHDGMSRLGMVPVPLPWLM
ncbi:MAG: hypothetical protein NT080_11725 [Spirochaetes bacterium]|nr:hypothetical protein [Spirochaetota bacterium]